MDLIEAALDAARGNPAVVFTGLAFHGYPVAFVVFDFAVAGEVNDEAVVFAYPITQILELAQHFFSGRLGIVQLIGALRADLVLLLQELRKAFGIPHAVAQGRAVGVGIHAYHQQVGMPLLLQGHLLHGFIVQSLVLFCQNLLFVVNIRILGNVVPKIRLVRSVCSR